MLKIVILATFLATANAYLGHGAPTAVIPPNYGHYNDHYGGYGSYGNYGSYGHAAPAIAPVPAYNHPTAVAPYVHPKPVAPAIVNPYPAASRHNLNAHYQGGYAHSGYQAASYVPPPVIAPPTVTYNHNVIPPSVHNVNHGPAPINYPHHAQAINYHARYTAPISPLYAHGHMYQNHVNYGW